MRDEFKRKNKSRTVIISLIVVVLLLIGFIAWAFIAKPAIDTYILEKQQTAYTDAIEDILTQVQQNGFVQIPISETQSVILDVRLPKQTA